MSVRLPGRRVAVVFVLAALLAGSATWFGYAFAAEEHGHEADAVGEVVEHGGAEAVHEEAGGVEKAGAGAVASAILIGLVGGALAPGSVLLARRRDIGVPADATARDAGTLGLALAALSTGAAAVHFAVVAQHFEEWRLTGLFFVVVAVLQVVWAAVSLLRPSAPLYLAGAIGNALVVVTWIVSRTTGVPVGPEAGEPEPVGFVDLVATGWEVLIVALAIALLVGGRQTEPQAARAAPGWLSGAIVASLTALALALLP